MSPDVNSHVCKRSPDFLDLCSTVLQYKTKHSRGNDQKKHALTFLLISEYNWLHFTTTEGRGNVHANTAASINTKKTGLHPTTDSALRPTVLMVVNIFHSSTNGSDCCCAIIINREARFQMSRSGPKKTPIHDSNTWPKTTPNHGTCERERDKGSVRNTQKTPVLQK